MDNYGIRSHVLTHGKALARRKRYIATLQDTATVVAMLACVTLILFI